MAEKPAAPVAATGEAVVAQKRRVATATFLLGLSLEGGLASMEPRPGQFYQVRCGEGREHMLRRPLSVSGFEAGERPVVEFLFEVVGWGTWFLAGLEAGDRVSLFGPLGRGFDTSGDAKALLVGGGAGVAPLRYLAAGMEEAGREYEFIAGFADAGRLPEGILPPGVIFYTDDGSAGERGVACDGIEPALARGCGEIFACGPEDMMAVAASVSARHGLRCQVSLDERMACGLGACRGCVRQGADGLNVCVCTDGPVFDAIHIWGSGTLM